VSLIGGLGTTMVKISVCIATYNGAKYIKEQLTSILTQLNDDAEIIISDDSSTDNTIQIIKALQDKRIVVYPNQKFSNAIFNFENALKHCHGDFIFLADQDDVWLPGRVNKILAFVNDYDLIVSDCKVVNENLEILEESYFSTVNARPGLFRNLMRTSPYVGCCMAFKRKVLEKALPFPENIAMHDFWIAMLSEALFKIKFIYEPLLLYRRHASNLSFTASENKNPLHKKILYRINTMIPLIKRIFR
jgi:glycosyltransferase involved in cell wall biosynthesis